MGDRSSRLAIAAVFLSFVVVFFAFELALGRLKLSFFQKTLKIGNDSVSKFQYFFPFGFALLGIIIIPVMLSDRSGNAKEQETEIDPDIGGPGIRFAIWAQVLVLILIAIIGTFHTRANGAKEIGAGLVVTHVSLAVALLVETAKRKTAGGSERHLGAAGAILGCMILDSQNIALSIPLVIKETLASRWQVCIIITCQCFGLVVMAVIVQLFSDGTFLPNEDAGRIDVVWWGWLNSRKSRNSAAEMEVFWVYYACRWLILLQTSFHALGNMTKFDKAAKQGSEAELVDITFPALVRDVTFIKSPVDFFMKIWKPSPTLFDRYPTTVSLMYILYGVYSLASLAAAETAMRTFGPQENHDFSVGQVIAVVVAGITILRAIWLFFGMFVKWRGFIPFCG